MQKDDIYFCICCIHHYSEITRYEEWILQKKRGQINSYFFYPILKPENDEIAKKKKSICKRKK